VEVLVLVAEVVEERVSVVVEVAVDEAPVSVPDDPDVVVGVVVDEAPVSVPDDPDDPDVVVGVVVDEAPVSVPDDPDEDDPDDPDDPDVVGVVVLEQSRGTVVVQFPFLLVQIASPEAFVFIAMAAQYDPAASVHQPQPAVERRQSHMASIEPQGLVVP